MTIFRSISKPLTIFAGDPRAIYFPLLDATGAPQLLTGRAFRFVVRRVNLITPLLLDVDMYIALDGLSAIALITAAQSQALFDANVDYGLSYDVVEVTDGASTQRWTGRIAVAPSPGMPNDVAPVWVDLAAADVVAASDVIAISERGAVSPIERRLKDLGLTDEATPEAMVQWLQAQGATGAIPLLTETQEARDAAVEAKLGTDENLAATEDAKTAAQLAATTSQFAGKLYPPGDAGIAAGLAATAEGNEFYVQSADNGEVAIVYRKLSGAAFDTGKRTPSANAVLAQASVVNDDGLPADPANLVASTIEDDTGSVLMDFLRNGGLLSRFLKQTGEGGWVWEDEEGGIVFEIDPQTGVWFRQAEKEQPLYVPPDPTILLGPKLWVPSGEALSLYADSIFPSRENVEDITLSLSVTPTATSGVPRSYTGRQHISVPASSLTGTSAELLARSTASRIDTMSRRAMTIQTGPLNGAGKTVVLFGALLDSIGNRQQLQYVNDFLVSWGFTVIWLGTVRTAATGDRFDATGPLSEAREARAYADMTYSVLDGEIAPIAPGGEAAYLALPKDQKWGYNPFIRASVGGEDPAKIRNGYVVDIPRYAGLFLSGQPAPTHVFDGEGKNDVLEDPAGAGARMVDGINLFYPSIRAAWPSTRIVKWLPPTPRSAQADREWLERDAPAYRAAIKAVLDFAATDPLTDFLNLHATVDPASLWPLQALATDPTGSQSVRISDIVHPGATDVKGRRALAFQIAVYVALTA